MSLHPIKVLDQVMDEYREYLRSEFQAKDPSLRAALERELDAAKFLAQEPFFQAHRPFKNGKRWCDLPIDPRLAKVMKDRARKHGSTKPDTSFLHQSEAIEYLLSPEASSLVVTTGTGSGKTEAFLLPVIQNAIEDAARFRKSGLTAILVYPMNALANDQLLRIQEYLGGAGFHGTVDVKKYDRGTSQAEREELRRNPPHILLTNYMMLEYLLVRPADREDIFANHRCRFLVLDEVHTYRGTLGSNIAFLVRRLRTHLARARQDWGTSPTETEDSHRLPSLVSIGTSATIKSVSEEGRSRAEILRLRDAAVKEFFGKLAGVDTKDIKILGEELEDIQTPAEARYPMQPEDIADVDVADQENVRAALCWLAGLPPDTSLEDAASRCRLIWDLNRWLIAAPLCVSQLTDRMLREVPERKDLDPEMVRREVEAGLVVGAALPDGVPGSLRLRAHRIVRGGWRFHRCVNPECGKLYPMGEERCGCGHATAPLYLCRNCGAHFLRFVGNPDEGTLRPSAVLSEGPEWLLYDPSRLETMPALESDELEEDEAPVNRPTRRRQVRQMRRRPVLRGSFDCHALAFSSNETDYAMKVTLAPARTQCLCCGGSAGSRSVVTPVALGTSAAVKAVGEGLMEALAFANKGREGHDGKERLLIFSDSRQDAAHQARFIIFASRYDRMRRRVVRILSENGSLGLQRTVELLGDAGVREQDNPYAPPDLDSWIPDEMQRRIRAWEEAPLLDDISVTSGYRATLINLGLAGIRHHRLGEYIRSRGTNICQMLAISEDALEHTCRCLLDEMCRRGALSREMLRYHPLHPSCPDYMRAAEWERRVKQPRGYAASRAGRPLAYLDSTEVPPGITVRNAWRKPGVGGRGPSLEGILKQFLKEFGGIEPSSDHMQLLLDFLLQGSFIIGAELFGARNQAILLQVNSEVLHLELTNESTRLRCGVCGLAMFAAKKDMPCPRCHGRASAWLDSEIESNRSVRRIRAPEVVPLFAGEHTAQVPNDVRIELEDNFRAAPSASKVNVLACSPTLEMGIDVGGLDAVILRNVPPRPDNYAQRGGRAGRRSRVGLVLGYARSTPHDQYFYDKPAEMIAGEVPAPALTLGNRDVILRHLNSIVFGASDPGLAGKMAEYVSPTGEPKQESVDALIAGVRAQFGPALAMAKEAFGDAVLTESGLTAEGLMGHLENLPERVQDVVNRTARQVQELRRQLDIYAAELRGARAGNRAAELVARLLGIQTERQRGQTEADDRSAGYPLRRFAEFGILPGYEFPTEPASLRLLGDEHEDDPVSVARRFGIAQYQPDAQVYARAKRWKVIGLDTSSPWNPRADGLGWFYRVCSGCDLRFMADHPRCPRCGTDTPGPVSGAAEFGGFLSRRDESPVLDEEERYAVRNLVASHPQWDGDVVGRWNIGSGWALRLSRRELVQWINEGLPPTPKDLEQNAPRLHSKAKGYLLCSLCGRILTIPIEQEDTRRGRRAPRNAATGADPYGHGDACPHRGIAPTPTAIATSSSAEVLRLLMPLPRGLDSDGFDRVGQTLGYALHAGMRQLYMLDGPEIEFGFEGVWKVGDDASGHCLTALTFIDPSLGGTGYLSRIAAEFNLVARRALEHLDHPNCETACYRCLKSYQNQRFHDKLQWPLAIPHLHALAESAPTPRPLETGDIDDPRPWLEAYAAGVGSPLELKFLRLFESHGFHPEKQVPVSAIEGYQPISVADFAVPERRLAIYVDGASIHVGSNLRRDRYIRDRLRNGTLPWRVEQLRATDLSAGAALVERLRR